MVNQVIQHHDLISGNDKKWGITAGFRLDWRERDLRSWIIYQRWKEQIDRRTKQRFSESYGEFWIEHHDTKHLHYRRRFFLFIFWKDGKFILYQRQRRMRKCQIGLDAFERKAKHIHKQNLTISIYCANVCFSASLMANTI